MIIPVHMLAFHDKGKIREVEVGDFPERHNDKDDILNKVFELGQNDFQPQDIPSVSVGDVIEIDILIILADVPLFSKSVL